MTMDDLIQALGLPESARVCQRVPKKMLAEHGAATAADKRQIQDGVDEITWLAAQAPLDRRSCFRGRAAPVR